MAVAVPFTFPAFRKICLPYVPATDAQVKNILRCLKNRRGNMIDLGSGDGRIVRHLNLSNRLPNFAYYRCLQPPN